MIFDLRFSIFDSQEVMKHMAKANCQSCGMPLSRDANGGGTEADGRKSTTYCSHCYQNGQFTEPDLTVDQMVVKVKGKMKEMHMPGFVGSFFTKDIPKLQRWAGR